jgi:hypothetical protein
MRRALLPIVSMARIPDDAFRRRPAAHRTVPTAAEEALADADTRDCVATPAIVRARPAFVSGRASSRRRRRSCFARKAGNEPAVGDASPPAAMPTQRRLDGQGVSPQACDPFRVDSSADVDMCRPLAASPLSPTESRDPGFCLIRSPVMERESPSALIRLAHVRWFVEGEASGGRPTHWSSSRGRARSRSSWPTAPTRSLAGLLQTRRSARSRNRRVGPAPCDAGPPSEPDVPVSEHPAQASPVGSLAGRSAGSLRWWQRVCVRRCSASSVLAVRVAAIVIVGRMVVSHCSHCCGVCGR